MAESGSTLRIREAQPEDAGRLVPMFRTLYDRWFGEALAADVVARRKAHVRPWYRGLGGVERAHRESFGFVRRAATLFAVSRLVDPDTLAEGDVGTMVAIDAGRAPDDPAASLDSKRRAFDPMNDARGGRQVRSARPLGVDAPNP